MKTFQASEFKARCLAIIDEVARTGERVTVVKRGRPVVQIVPAVAGEARFPQQRLIGSVEILGDVVSPAASSRCAFPTSRSGKSQRRTRWGA